MSELWQMLWEWPYVTIAARFTYSEEFIILQRLFFLISLQYDWKYLSHCYSSLFNLRLQCAKGPFDKNETCLDELAQVMIWQMMCEWPYVTITARFTYRFRNGMTCLNQTKMDKSYKIGLFTTIADKIVLTTTFKPWPPVSNYQPKPWAIKIKVRLRYVRSG
jgi:hypothetical protein